MSKTTRKNIHQGTKAKFRCRNRRKVQTTKMKMTTEPVLRTLMATVTETEDVTGIIAPTEGQKNE